MMLAILNIVTGTSKAFCFILYLFVVIWVALFNVAKLHRKCCGDSKFVNLFVENLWLVLTWFFFINHWAAFTVAMPYIVMWKWLFIHSCYIWINLSILWGFYVYDGSSFYDISRVFKLKLWKKAKDKLSPKIHSMIKKTIIKVSNIPKVNLAKLRLPLPLTIKMVMVLMWNKLISPPI